MAKSVEVKKKPLDIKKTKEQRHREGVRDWTDLY